MKIRIFIFLPNNKNTKPKLNKKIIKSLSICQITKHKTRAEQENKESPFNLLSNTKPKTKINK
jgi:hypothetical protein